MIRGMETWRKWRLVVSEESSLRPRSQRVSNSSVVRAYLEGHGFDSGRGTSSFFSLYLSHHLRNRKHVLCFYRVIETRVEVWENEKCCGNTSRLASVSTAFWSSPKLSRVFL